jgi:hypothetical protein
MTGLNSAGRALAIRHLALAALALADVIQSIGVLLQGGHAWDKDVVVTAVWFPVFAVFAAAPLFLYDRTAAQEGGPLLQLDRTPEVRTTARSLSVSSMVWLAVGALYLLYQPIQLWLFGPVRPPVIRPAGRSAGRGLPRAEPEHIRPTPPRQGEQR